MAANVWAWRRAGRFNVQPRNRSWIKLLLMKVTKKCTKENLSSPGQKQNSITKVGAGQSPASLLPNLCKQQCWRRIYKYKGTKTLKKDLLFIKSSAADFCIAAYVHGLLLCWYFIIVSPELKPIEKFYLKLTTNDQKNSVRPILAESCSKADCSSVAPA